MLPASIGNTSILFQKFWSILMTNERLHCNVTITSSHWPNPCHVGESLRPKTGICDGGYWIPIRYFLRKQYFILLVSYRYRLAGMTPLIYGCDMFMKSLNNQITNEKLKWDKKKTREKIPPRWIVWYIIKFKCKREQICNARQTTHYNYSFTCIIYQVIIFLCVQSLFNFMFETYLMMD